MTDPVGTFVHKRCRACGGDLQEVLNLGPLKLNAFPAHSWEIATVPSVPVILACCLHCSLVQLTHTVPPDLLYRDYWYRSAINDSMREELRTVVGAALAYVTLDVGDVVIDIGANDGTLLSYLADRDLIRVAYEPALNLHNKTVEHCEVLVPDYFPCDWTDHANTPRIPTYARNPSANQSEQRQTLAGNGRRVQGAETHTSSEGEDRCQAPGSSIHPGMAGETIGSTDREDAIAGDAPQTKSGNAPTVRNDRAANTTRRREVPSVAGGRLGARTGGLPGVPNTTTEIGGGPHSAVGAVSRSSLRGDERAGIVSSLSSKARVARKSRHAKIIFAVAMAYDLENPLGFFQAIRQLLHPEGVAVIQFQDLGQQIAAAAVDNCCHEHLEYYTLGSLMFLVEAAGLEVVKVETTPINGGSLRVLLQPTVIRREAWYPDSVRQQLARERLQGLAPDTIASGDLTAFAFMRRRVAAAQGHIRATLQACRDQGAVVDIVGASTKGNVLLQILGVGPESARQCIERSPEKHGRYTITGIPITSEEVGQQDPADVWYVSIWQFKQTVLERYPWFLARRGQLIFPLPHCEIVQGGFGAGVGA